MEFVALVNFLGSIQLINNSQNCTNDISCPFGAVFASDKSKVLLEDFLERGDDVVKFTADNHSCTGSQFAKDMQV
eukprot:CAMPEP_0176403756 /NCGR_PEP_ID=MMETSP0126-20121128/50355_1 /TAXON_ID=141414 ORGANISM="Strombidinopsis acuminatum, Strain SPMC142" /NCGR_SAMPLE_ID=MMETSP0126 /ASSEMBLY_ACC=CAM_ASM_000229 /LENGTH=74 /DNA_ID=CAMNT_0017782209 /DNA_START=152 /DNA_END=376 /DNA_ORIENTATION=+